MPGNVIASLHSSFEQIELFLKPTCGFRDDFLSIIPVIAVESITMEVEDVDIIKRAALSWLAR